MSCRWSAPILLGPLLGLGVSLRLDLPTVPGRLGSLYANTGYWVDVQTQLMNQYPPSMATDLDTGIRLHETYHSAINGYPESATCHPVQITSLCDPLQLAQGVALWCQVTDFTRWRNNTGLLGTEQRYRYRCRTHAPPGDLNKSGGLITWACLELRVGAAPKIDLVVSV